MKVGVWLLNLKYETIKNVSAFHWLLVISSQFSPLTCRSHKGVSMGPTMAHHGQDPRSHGGRGGFERARCKGFFDRG